jgi:hypothetical protein
LLYRPLSYFWIPRIFWRDEATSTFCIPWMLYCPDIKLPCIHNYISLVALCHCAVLQGFNQNHCCVPTIRGCFAIVRSLSLVLWTYPWLH